MAQYINGELILEGKAQDAIEQQYNGEGAINVGWDDIATSLVGRRLYSNAGTVDYNYADNSITCTQGGDITHLTDCVAWNIQKPHGMLKNGEIRMHVHWWQDFDEILDPAFTLWYRIQNHGDVKTSDWTEAIITSDVDNEVFPRPTVSGDPINQITKLVDIDMSTSGISAIVQFRLTRSDSVAGTIDVTFVDGHYPTDQERGSKLEYDKDVD